MAITDNTLLPYPLPPGKIHCGGCRLDLQTNIGHGTIPAGVPAAESEGVSLFATSSEVAEVDARSGGGGGPGSGPQVANRFDSKHAEVRA